MALATDYITAKAGIADRVWGFFSTFGQAMARRQMHAQTARELNALSDRDLADLGLVRSEIASIAYQAAYGS